MFRRNHNIVSGKPETLFLSLINLSRFYFILLSGLMLTSGRGLGQARPEESLPVLKDYVDRGSIAGAVTLVVKGGEVIHSGAIGYQDRKNRVTMKPDTLFQIMSMTKPITALAVMILADEGKLTLDDRVDKYLPEFRDPWVSEEAGPQDRRLRRAARSMTIRHLLTHRSGMSGNDPLPIEDPRIKMVTTLARNVVFFSQQPLLFDPGSHCLYSGPGFATLGRIVEIVANQSFERFLRDRIFRPLEMRDTCFFPTPEEQPRIASVYELKNGRLCKAEVDLYRKDAKYPNPAGGLFSTASDMVRILEMTLGGGQWKGCRILSRASVELMTRPQTGQSGDSPQSCFFGLGWEVYSNHPNAALGVSATAFGHAGAFGTFEWADPLKDLAGVFLIQLLGEEDHRERDEFIRFASRLAQQ